MALLKLLHEFVKNCYVNLPKMPKMMTTNVGTGDTSGPWRRSLTVSHFLNDSFPDLAVSPTSFFSTTS